MKYFSPVELQKTSNFADSYRIYVYHIPLDQQMRQAHRAGIITDKK